MFPVTEFIRNINPEGGTQENSQIRRNILLSLSSSSWSDLGHATIHDQFDAGDIATFVRSEKRHHFGNFVQGSGATEGILPTVLSAYCCLVLPSSPANCDSPARELRQD